MSDSTRMGIDSYFGILWNTESFLPRCLGESIAGQAERNNVKTRVIRGRSDQQREDLLNLEEMTRPLIYDPARQRPR